MARKSGISKARGYLTRIFTIEYDRAGQIEAYGIEFCRWLDEQILAGRVNCRQDVDRWAAHVALTKDYNFAKVKDSYGEQLPYDIEDAA